jgi:hypothetical protein
MKTKKLLAVAVIVVFTMVWATVALAWDCQQKYRNDTGLIVNDLEKVLEGIVTIDDAIHDKFANHSVSYDFVNGTTTITWDQGQVLPGESTWACFDWSGPQDNVVVKEVYWTIDGNRVADAGSPVSGDGTFEDPHGSGFGDAVIELSNTFELEFGITVPIDLSNVQWAFSPTRYTLEELTEDLLLPASGLVWNPLPNVTLPPGASQEYNLVSVPAHGYLILYCESEQSGTGLLPTVEMIQWETGTDNIPTLTNWGLLSLIVLLLAAAAFVIIHRRRVNA